MQVRLLLCLSLLLGCAPLSVGPVASTDDGRTSHVDSVCPSDISHALSFSRQHQLPFCRDVMRPGMKRWLCRHSTAAAERVQAHAVGKLLEQRHDGQVWMYEEDLRDAYLALWPLDIASREPAHICHRLVALGMDTHETLVEVYPSLTRSVRDPELVEGLYADLLSRVEGTELVHRVVMDGLYAHEKFNSYLETLPRLQDAMELYVEARSKQAPGLETWRAELMPYARESLKWFNITIHRTGHHALLDAYGTFVEAFPEELEMMFLAATWARYIQEDALARIYYERFLSQASADGEWVAMVQQAKAALDPATPQPPYTRPVLNPSPPTVSSHERDDTRVLRLIARRNLAQGALDACTTAPHHTVFHVRTMHCPNCATEVQVVESSLNEPEVLHCFEAVLSRLPLSRVVRDTTEITLRYATPPERCSEAVTAAP